MKMSVPNKSIFCGLIVLIVAGCVNAQSKSFEEALKDRSLKLETLCDPKGGLVNMKILEEYGAYFTAQNITFPPTCRFHSASEVTKFWADLVKNKQTKMVVIADKEFEFQICAAQSLERVFRKLIELGINPAELPRGYSNRRGNVKLEFKENGKDVRPGGANKDWASRTYEDTLRNFGMTGEEPENVEAKVDKMISGELSVKNQTLKTPTYFSDNNRPKMRSVALPGTSQHTVLIAFDLNTSIRRKSDVVEELNKAGWYRTVPNDDDHFTYLGWNSESQLKANGLKKVICKGSSGLIFWIPNITSFESHQYRNWECTNAN